MAQIHRHPHQFSLQTLTQLLFLVFAALFGLPAFGNIHPLSHKEIEDVHILHSEETHGGRLVMEDTLMSDHDLSIHMGKDPRTLASDHHTFVPEEVTAHTMTDEHRANDYKGTKSILISGFGRHWILDLLMNQVAIGEQAMNFVYDKVTEKYTHDKIPASTCHYHGFVRGSERTTWVAASTCNGLIATFYDGNVSYNTAPLGGNLSTTHVIYRTLDVHSKDADATCGVKGHDHSPEILNQPLDDLASSLIGEDHYKRAKRQSILTPTASRTLIDFFAVMDIAFLSFFGNNRAAASLFVNNAVNFMDMAYITINARVRSLGQLQFIGANEFFISTSGINLLNAFNTFIGARRASLGVNFDSAQLITGVNFDDNTIGLAFINTVCTGSGHSLVEQLNGRPFTFTSLIMSHELGHTLNMGHDGDPGLETCNNCPANLGRCIMFPSLGSSNQNFFSQCSVNALNTVRGRSCLTNFVEAGACGNGIVDAGEACDCGFAQVCTDPCCNPLNCQLQVGAQCASGDCCNRATCQFMPSNTVCNAADSSNLCDLDDICTGTSGQCPALTRRNGAVCRGSTENLCWNGNCVTREAQCMTLFGAAGSAGNDACYAMNIDGNRTGNCGINRPVSTQGNLQFTACSERNVLCGKLHCGNTGLATPDVAVPASTELTTISIGGGSTVECKGGTIDDLSFLLSGAPDVTLVSNGQNCGGGNVCLDQECFEQSDAATGIDFCGMVNGLECNNGGVCDNSLVCRCNAGFSGVLCQINADDCPAANPCQNGGTCVDGANAFSCMCTAAFTGQFCADTVDNCASGPCLNGATCSNEVGSFVCTCAPGFTGSTCQSETDECATAPCLNNATCTDLQLAFECTCLAGFTGSTCAENIDDCADMPCLNGECVDGIAAFQCICNPGFTGMRCESDINECLPANPCQNDGTCMDLVNDFLCTCAPGFTGATCQQDIDECFSDPCANGATCLDGINGFFCICVPGFTGLGCQTDFNECASMPCANDGTCLDQVNGFICQCVPGFTGLMCETNINECSSDPCVNGATCIDQVNGFVCECVAGFTGIMCETDINECDITPCLNGGTCTDLINGVSCECRPGFTGMMCGENIDECMSEPCNNGGTCVDGVNRFDCTCPPSFTGLRCQTNTNECLSMPCVNGATCTDTEGSFFCTCTTGFTGQLCADDIDECLLMQHNCDFNATCINNDGGFDCQCLPGFTGNGFECMEINECAGMPCLNGATCVDQVNSFVCQCQAGFTGSYCETDINECMSMPCFNDGTCTDMVNGFACTCVAGFTNVRCQTNINECFSNPCSNSGSCIDEVNGFLCNCAPGFTGVTCDEDIDECLSMPCQNLGTCVDQVNGFSCQCLAGFTGTQCQTNINECMSEPCINGGTCIDQVDGFICSCVSGFTGLECETDINECMSMPCNNSGTCVDQVNGFVCDCSPGFTGDQCEIDIDECESSPCVNGGTCTDQVNGFVCDCVAGFTGANCFTNIDECLSRPCRNDATCVDQVNMYQCVCAPGFTGTFCGENIDECLSSPCDNGGTCVDQVNGFVCTCAQGFTGVVCQTDIDECDNSPCQNNSTCVNLPGTFDCLCVPGFTSMLCDVEINECDFNLCENGATCTDLLNDFACTCDAGFTGRFCETNLNDCFNVVCQNGGTCVDGVGDFTCVCNRGSFGRFCEQRRSPCFPSDQAEGVITQSPLPLTVPASYIGCFNDTGLRAQDKLLVLGCPDVSVCSNTCRGMGFPFASLQFTPNGMENDCICGCSFANSGDVSRPAADCMQMCTNGNNQDPFCGAIDARAVYMTGATVNP